MVFMYNDQHTIKDNQADFTTMTNNPKQIDMNELLCPSVLRPCWD